MMASPAIVLSTVLGKNSPSNRINVGAIGTGRISREHDMPGVWNNGTARIVAVCDLDSNRVSEAKQLVESQYAKMNIRSNVKTFGDYRELLGAPDIDAVLISTPDHWHAKPVIDAAYAGKDIYVQKPFSMTLIEGRQMSNAVHKTGRILQIGTQQRSMEQFRVACELVRNGRIGELKTVKVGLPIDPAGEVEPEMPVPRNLNYEMWLGSTPYVYYTEKRVHPQADYSRPGWLRCDAHCLGMITGWGVHHMDIVHWAMDMEYSGPVEVSGKAEYPAKGLWNVHGKYHVEARYSNGVTVQICDEFPNGIRFEGAEGWIFVTRGDYSATGSDPAAQGKNNQALTASNPKILTSPLGPNATRLFKSSDHHGNWLECVKSRLQPLTPAEVGHRSTSVCIISFIAMKLGRKLYWDPLGEHFKNDDEANAMLSRPQRWPYQIN
jgi:predicted dehydrogenase